ncbi:hypothetical protein ACSBL2_14320 [Pedobacter sp. AW31-3R]|uniref:hypothetical protein n=1 Tax=Pedobacter sp. AW31-3R TaxID=3445781 RepID=UPI003F9F3EEB
MHNLYRIIKADYLQRTRSYAFLITMAITTYIAYSFIPTNDASYTTLSTVGYKGAYNSAWVGYVSAIMTTVMLSFYGFLLVNSGIKKDMDTEVGLIIATTPITNFQYLLSKQLSNYLVLVTIAACTFVVSLLMFFVRGTGYPFILGNFILPYVFFALPALFLVASLAVAAEVFLVRRGLLQYIIYLFLCSIIMVQLNKASVQEPSGVLDPFGLSLMMSGVKGQINTQFHEHIQHVSFGFIFSGPRPYQLFVWNGLNWSVLFILSRLIWISLGIGLVYISSFFFHRFDFKQKGSSKRTKKQPAVQQNDKLMLSPAGVNRTLLPAVTFNFSIYPFIKTELLLLIRQGNKWLWLVNAGLWIALFLAPFQIAYLYLLPLLLFFQVTRWSDLVTKEKTNRIHYFAYASYKPMQRMLPSQILAGIILALGLALPVLLRSVMTSNLYAFINILNGSVCIVLLAVATGILTGGKKLFEVIFFLLTYAVLNKVPVTDYLGSLPHQNMARFIITMLGINLLLTLVSFLARSYEVRHL